MNCSARKCGRQADQTSKPKPKKKLVSSRCTSPHGLLPSPFIPIFNAAFRCRAAAGVCVLWRLSLGGRGRASMQAGLQTTTASARFETGGLPLSPKPASESSILTLEPLPFVTYLGHFSEATMRAFSEQCESACATGLCPPPCSVPPSQSVACLLPRHCILWEK